MFRNPIYGEEGSRLRLFLIVLSFVLFIIYILKSESYGMFIPAALGALAYGKYLFDIYSE